jgi:hypothetical protein
MIRRQPKARVNWTALGALSAGIAAVVALIGLIKECGRSSAPQQSAKASDHSTVNQAIASDHSIINQPGGQVIINITKSGETVRTQLQQTITAHEELSQRYPLGYVLFGIAGGNVVFQKPETGLELSPNNKAVIKIDSVKKRATVSLVFFQATFPNGFPVIMESVKQIFPYVENQPEKFAAQFGFGKNGELIDVYIEVIDSSKFIFLLGFKYAE